jgi:hypothetical protein
MLLHLPIVLLATLSPIAVSDTVPKFDVARECRYEGGSTSDIDRCSRDEAAALQRLKNEWVRFAGADKSSCMKEVTTLEFRSYVELQVCLEIAGSEKSTNHGSPGSLGNAELHGIPAGSPGLTVGIGDVAISSRTGR